jgi:hypothetical protein
MSALDWIDWDYDSDFDQEPVPTRRERALEKLANFSRMLARRKAGKAKPQAPSGGHFVTHEKDSPP